MSTLRPLIVTFAGIALLGCADTNAPLPDPVEVLLVVNSTGNTLSIVPVEDPGSAVQVPLGGTTPTPVGVSARKDVALVPLGLDNAVAVVDRRARVFNRDDAERVAGAVHHQQHFYRVRQRGIGVGTAQQGDPGERDNQGTKAAHGATIVRVKANRRPGLG
jgi:hypothetical protein